MFHHAKCPLHKLRTTVEMILVVNRLVSDNIRRIWTSVHVKLVVHLVVHAQSLTVHLGRREHQFWLFIGISAKAVLH